MCHFISNFKLTYNFYVDFKFQLSMSREKTKTEKKKLSLHQLFRHFKSSQIQWLKAKTIYMLIILKFGFSSAKQLFGWKHLASLIVLQSPDQQTRDGIYRMVPGLRPGRSEASAGMARMAGRLSLSSMQSITPGFFRAWCSQSSKRTTQEL